MKRFLISAALSVLTASVAMAPAAFAFAPPPHGDVHANDRGNDHRGDDHGQPGNHGHADWKKGGRIEKTDWNRGQKVDYHSHHLRQPPRGYEWRQVDGNYVLAAVATGLIASVILNSH